MQARELAGYEGFIRSSASRLTSDRDLQLDLMQEMRLHLWLEHQHNPGQTESYYRQGCIHRARDYIKHGCSVDSRKHRGDLVVTEIEPPTRVDDVLLVTDLADRIRSRLGAVTRHVFDLLRGGKRASEIAQAMGVSQQAVGKHVATIRSQTRRTVP